MIDARRLAQIGIFLLGLVHIEVIILNGPALVRELLSEGPIETSFALVYFGQLVFVLSLLIGSAGWAKLVNVPGSVSSFSSMKRDDLLMVAIPCLGLFLLVTGVADVIGETVQWFQQRELLLGQGLGNPQEFPSQLQIVPFLRALAGIVLILWGASVVELVRWARGLGRSKGERSG